ncbi:hypothetical protein ACWDCC_04065 [Streptomyces sp. NPDC001102]
MSSARRPLLTATAAGTLLAALWFVPSANASQAGPERTQPETVTTTQARATSQLGESEAVTSVDDTQLADTGSIDTTPYVVGGTFFLTLGAGFVVYSVRRERLGF